MAAEGLNRHMASAFPYATYNSGVAFTPFPFDNLYWQGMNIWVNVSAKTGSPSLIVYLMLRDITNTVSSASTACSVLMSNAATPITATGIYRLTIHPLSLTPQNLANVVAQVADFIPRDLIIIPQITGTGSMTMQIDLDAVVL
jgi:hypothetical protein